MARVIQPCLLYAFHKGVNMKKKILFDDKRHGSKIEDDAIMVSGYSWAEKVALIESPNHKVHDISAWIEVDVSALDKQVLSSDGFDIAPNHINDFRNYSLYRINLAKNKAMIKIGSSSPVWEEIATNEQLEAFLNKFDGKDNLYESPLAKKDEYYIKSIEELKTMTWVDLKKYLKKNSIDDAYDLRSETLTRDALYADINNGVYDVGRM